MVVLGQVTGLKLARFAVGMFLVLFIEKGRPISFQEDACFSVYATLIYDQDLRVTRFEPVPLVTP